MNKDNVPVLDPDIVGLTPLILKVVALGNDTVVFLIVVTPVVAPKTTAVAAPNALILVKLVLNKDNVPVLDPDIVGLTPLILKVVALGNDTVVFLTVVIPVVAPITRSVEAPKALTVVATVL